MKLHELTIRRRRLTPPAIDPVALGDLKAHCAIASDVTDFDAILSGFLRTASAEFETASEFCPIAQRWELALERFPTDEIQLWPGPVRAVESVRYLDADGDLQTLDAADYQVDLTDAPARICRAWSTPWPSIRPGPRAVLVTYLCGAAAPITAVDAAADTLTLSLPLFAAGDRCQVATLHTATPPTGLTAAVDYFVRSPTGSSLQLAAASGGAAIDITGAGTGTRLLGDRTPAAEQAVKLLAAYWFRYREAATERPPQAIANAWDALVHSCRWRAC